MHLRHIFIYIAFSLVSLSLFICCDEVDEADRLIYVKPATVGRNVLIEDYTGQRCINCPTGNDQLHALQEQYGADTVVVVSFHSGPLAQSPRHKPYALWTQDGEDYYGYWKVAAQPSVLVDRTVLNETSTDWPAIVRTELEKTAPLSLKVVADYNVDARKSIISVEAMGTDGSTNGHIQLWITESDIVDFQYMPDGSVNQEYVHHHVYRDKVNGLWGDVFSIKEGEQKTVSFEYAIPADQSWVPEKMSIVAFVYNDAGVQQVATCPFVMEKVAE